MTSRQPPRFHERILSLAYRDPVVREDVTTSLREEFVARARRDGRSTASWWYRKQAWGIVRHTLTETMGVVGSRFVRDLISDARYGARGLARQPGFTLGTAATLGIGIAMTTTMFSLVYAMLVKPLPFPEPEQVVAVWPERWYSPAFFDVLVEQTSSFEALAAWQWRAHLDVRAEGTTRLWGPRVSAHYFDVLDPRAHLGRTFIEGEDTPGNDGVVVLSHSYWRRRFGEDPNVLGRTIDLRGTTRTIVGVMGAGYEFLRPGTDVIIPIVRDRGSVRYGDSSYKVIGRLRRGVTLEQATANLQALLARLRQSNDLPPEWGADARVVPLNDTLMGDVRPTLLLLMSAAGLLLLISTANVAHLVGARALARRREVSLRSALGAGTSRLMRQHWAESTLLGLVGVVPGVVGTFVSLPVVLRMLPSETPRLDAVELHLPVLFFCLGLGLVTGWLAGIVPSLWVGRQNLRAALVRSTGKRNLGFGRFSRFLVGSEVALAVTLLATSGVLAKSLWKLSELDPGFRTEGALTFEVVAPPGRLNTLMEAEQYFEGISRAVEALPGVASVAQATRAPMAPDGNVVSVFAKDRPPANRDAPTRIRWLQASPGFFVTSGITLLDGRTFSDMDNAQTDPVAIITQRTAEVVFPGEDPLGKAVVTGFEDFPVTVVGIVADQRMLTLDQEAPLIVYRPFLQGAAVAARFGVRSDRAFIVQADDPRAIIPIITSTLRTVDPAALVEGVRSVEDAIAGSVVGRRTVFILLGLFASTALIMGSIGVFGVLALAVQGRRKEIGVRLALGAPARSVLGNVLYGGLKVGMAGTLAGLLIVAAGSKILSGFAYHVSVSDPAILGATAGVVLAGVVAASLLPALRALRTDPVEVLADTSG